MVKSLEDKMSLARFLTRGNAVFSRADLLDAAKKQLKKISLEMHLEPFSSGGFKDTGFLHTRSCYRAEYSETGLPFELRAHDNTLSLYYRLTYGSIGKPTLDVLGELTEENAIKEMYLAELKTIKALESAGVLNGVTLNGKPLNREGNILSYETWNGEVRTVDLT